MNIAIMCHTKKQDLMVQFCTAYCGILSKHTVCATNATGRMVAEATGLPVNLFLSHEHGGIEQIGQRIIYNEIDMVLFFQLLHRFLLWMGNGAQRAAWTALVHLEARQSGGSVCHAENPITSWLKFHP